MAHFQKFKSVLFEEWLAQPRQLSTTPATGSVNSQSGNPPAPHPPVVDREAADPGRNPALKLVDYLAANLEDDGGAGHGEETVGGIVFEIDEAEKLSVALRDAPAVILSGLLDKMVEVWIRRWDAGGCKSMPAR